MVNIFVLNISNTNCPINTRCKTKLREQFWNWRDGSSCVGETWCVQKSTLHLVNSDVVVVKDKRHAVVGGGVSVNACWVAPPQLNDGTVTRVTRGKQNYFWVRVIIFRTQQGARCCVLFTTCTQTRPTSPLRGPYSVLLLNCELWRDARTRRRKYASFAVP